jgi:hypothetical protein
MEDDQARHLFGKQGDLRRLPPRDALLHP